MDRSAKKERQEKAIGDKQGSAFITTRKGFCYLTYLTIKCGRRNFHVMRIRAYTLDADDKRQMRRLYPDVDFDWKKIARQLAEKREVCRRYRSRWRTSTVHLSRIRAPFYGLYEPGTRTIYVNGLPRNAQAVGALLDAAAAKKGQPATPGTMGFRGVPEGVRDFHIGGYQVCKKWLKDRRGRTLSENDIAHYEKIIVAFAETIRLMKEIDEVIEQHGGWPGAFVTGGSEAVATHERPNGATDHRVGF